jgi:hypothetical protein
MMLWPIVVVVGLIAANVSKQWFDLLRLYRRAYPYPYPWTWTWTWTQP